MYSYVHMYKISLCFLLTTWRKTERDERVGWMLRGGTCEERNTHVERGRLGQLRKRQRLRISCCWCCRCVAHFTRFRCRLLRRRRCSWTRPSSCPSATLRLNQHAYMWAPNCCCIVCLCVCVSYYFFAFELISLNIGGMYTPDCEWTRAQIDCMLTAVGSVKPVNSNCNCNLKVCSNCNFNSNWKTVTE